MRDDYIEVEEILLDTIDTSPPAIIEPFEHHSVEGAHFIVRNIAFDRELDYFLTDDGLPVYYSDGISYNQIGCMMPTLASIFKAKFLDTEISFVNSAGEEKDLSLPENLIHFIDLDDGGDGVMLSVIQEIGGL